MGAAQFSLSSIDLFMLGVYFVFMIALGIWLSKGNKSSEDYFLASRSMTWPVVGLSLFASQISSTSLVGLAGAAYGTGISTYNYEWMSAALLVFFSLFILPFILKSQVFTMPEFLAKRYDNRARVYFSVITLILNIVVDTAGSLFAGALIVKLVFPQVEIWQTVVVLALAAGLYTIVGGLKAVMVTDVVQAIVLIIGSILIAVFAINAAGGLAEINNSIAPEKLSLIQPMDDPAVPWLGVLTGIPLLGFYFWCTNQFMVQRVLSAKDINHGRWGALFAGALKIPVLFTMVLPGSAALLLYPDLPQADLVYPTLMFDLLPVGVLGLVLAGFVAALMSQIDSTLNSASTLVTMDFVHRHKPNLTDEELLRTGKLATFTFMMIAVLWAPQIERFSSLFQYLQNVLAYAVPPVVALFLFGIFWPRANARGAIVTIWVGISTAALLFVLNELPGEVLNLHFLYVAPILFLVCCLTMIVASFSAPAPAREKIDSMIWSKSYFKEETTALMSMPWWQNYRYQSLAILVWCGVVVAAYW
ncbi:MAG: sodium:solute symporter [Kordiimonadaceae bacterium]|nr:sodium:solute symporter [Kordiimonadaceae bacterium]MBO6569207.1 sodium:solute symporter [Kordiimonadaceae bacterium]MBO6964683.1 sodium:solute symporter [Kordiimonadaceae bacterium]